MMRMLIAAMIVVSVIEIVLLVTIGQWIGGWQTFLLIILTSMLGAFFAKKEGAKALHTIRYQWASGQIPTQPILDAAFVFAGGLLLLAPGFFTDALGFLLILPYSRKFFAGWALLLLQNYFRKKGWF